MAVDPRLVSYQLTDFLGMDTKSYPSKIAMGFCKLLKNADLTYPGEIRSRLGYARIADDLGSTKIRALTSFRTGTDSYLVCYTGTKVYTWAGTGNWTESLAGLQSDEQKTLIQAGTRMVLCGGSDTVRTWNGSIWTDEGNTNTDPPVGCAIAAYFLNRLFLAGNQDNPDYVWYSDTLDVQTWNRAVNVAKIGNGDGEKITGLAPFGQDKLLVFKERSVWMLDLSDPTTAPYEAPIYIVDGEYGCIAPRSITYAGDQIYFLSEDGVRIIRRTEFNSIFGGSLPVSDPMKEYWDARNANVDVTAQSVGFTWKNYLCFAFPYAESQYNNYVMVRDLVRGGWMLWTGMNVHDYTFSDVSGEWQPYFGEASADGKVYRTFYGHNDNGSAISFEVQTSSLSFGNELVDKTLQMLEIGYVPCGGTLTLKIETNESGMSSITETIDTTATGLTFPITFNITFPAAGPNLRIAKIADLESFRQFRTAKLSISHSSLDNYARIVWIALWSFALESLYMDE